MQPIRALLILPFMVLVFRIVESTEDKYAPENLFSTETKEAMKKLQGYLDNYSYEKLRAQMKEDNHVLTSYKKYLKAYQFSKDTPCKHGDPPGANDKEVIDVFVNECVDSPSKPTGGILTFQREIKKSMDRVKGVDDFLRENAANCESNSACEENKKKALDNLRNIMSADVTARFDSDGNRVLSKAQEYLNECFADETGGLLKELEDAIKEIYDCMDQQDDVIEKTDDKD